MDRLQRFLVGRRHRQRRRAGRPDEEAAQVAVVRELDEAGFFLIRDSVDHLAGELDVTRYTIYNYLNEVRG